MAFKTYEKDSNVQGTAIVQTFIIWLVFVTEHLFLCRFKVLVEFYNFIIHTASMRSNTKSSIEPLQLTVNNKKHDTFDFFFFFTYIHPYINIIHVIFHSGRVIGSEVLGIKIIIHFEFIPYFVIS